MIELSPQQTQFVDAQVSAGVFTKPGEVVGAALDILQQRQTEYERLRSAIDQIDRGEVKPLDIEDIKRRSCERRAAR
jgi:putative addiction module CopG family antidote